MTTRRSPWGARIAVAALALAGLTACGSNSDSPAVSSTASPAAVATSAPSATTSAASTPTSASEAADTLSAQTPKTASPQRGLPTSAGNYSEAFMQAWSSGDTAAMGTYATANVVEQLSATRPQGALLRTACEDSLCSYTDEQGGRVTLTLDLAKVDAGATAAITSVSVNR